MRRFLLSSFLSLSLLAGAGSQIAAAQQAAASPSPKLVLVIMVDQFRYDYLTRFREEYTSGLDRLLRQGAVFTSAYFQHFPTVTAVGHSVILSGAMPALSGIIGNEWYDRELKKQVTSVSDRYSRLLGADGTGSTPRKLLVGTVGDEMKMSGRGQPKVIGISLKDRAAILPVGRMADGAFWFHGDSGNFVSSTYYYAKLPDWAQRFNESRAADWFLGAEWKPIDDPKGEPFTRMTDKAGPSYWDSIAYTPFGNELVEMFAEAAVTGENLGQGATPDLLAVSFSSNDYVGHRFGPDSARVRDVSIRTDRTLGKLFQFLDTKIGMRNVLVVLSADHGVAPFPEVMEERGMPAGRISEQRVLDSIQNRLSSLYGSGKWVSGVTGASPYLNNALIAERHLDPVEVRRQAAEAVRRIPHIFRVYTRDQLASGEIPGDEVNRRIQNGFYPQRASDLVIVQDPYYLFEPVDTSHGTPFNYDAHVPIILMGPGIMPGSYPRKVAVNDVAPTLATLLGVEIPSGSVGNVLVEALAPVH